jgi:hypothetical protein
VQRAPPTVHRLLEKLFALVAKFVAVVRSGDAVELAQHGLSRTIEETLKKFQTINQSN